MAFPYVFEANLESGTNAEFTSEVDTENKLSIAHYAMLAKHPARLELPYSGAYAAYINLAGGTADAYLQEDTGFDLALAGVRALRLLFYAKGLTMAADDRFTILALQSAGPVDELTISVLNTAGRVRLVMAETGATAVASGRSIDLIEGQWHTLEIVFTLDAGGGNDGTATFYVDGYQVGAAVTALDQAALIHARLGAIGIDAGTTAGHLLFDSLVVDDTRVFPVKRFGQTRLMTKSGHAFIGPGALSSITLLPAANAADAVLALYDTDEANTAAPLIVPELRIDVSESLTYTVPLAAGVFQRGCYAVLSGTNPRAFVTARRATDSGVGPIRSYVENRPAHGVS